MRFDLDEQQRAFQDAISDYLRAECPINRALEPFEDGEADLAVWCGLMELGIGGMLVPEAYGGLGLGLLDLAVVAELVGRHAVPGPFFEHALATLAIALAASPEQKEKWLPGLASGALRATVALAETKGQWLADGWTLDGERLFGRKQYVLHPEGADIMVVGLKGGALGVVRCSDPGIALTLLPSTDAGRQLAHVDFDGVRCERLAETLGARVVDAGLILLAADAFGGASQAVHLAVEYSKEREQFGQPIGAFQAVKHQLADMALMVEPCQGLYWFAAHQFDSASSEDAAKAAALAKAHISEVYPKIARRMIEAHGGIGYTWEYGAHIWLKRALFDQAYLGMPQDHRVRIATLHGW